MMRIGANDTRPGNVSSVVRFVDPRPSEVWSPATAERVRPVAASSGARPLQIGLLANGYPDSAEFLRLLGLELAGVTGCSTVAVTKAAPPVPLDEEQLAALARCSAVVAAYGH